jgi:hypothetical protein
MTKFKVRRRNGQIDLPRMWEDASVERRKRMTDEELWLDIMQEFREAARLRTTLYQNELAKDRPRVPVLIKLWSDNYEDYEMAAMATPPRPTQDCFKQEMALSDLAIDKLSAPYLKRINGDG